MIRHSQSSWTLQTFPHATADIQLDLSFGMALQLHDYLDRAQHYLAGKDAITDLRNVLGPLVEPYREVT